MSKLFRVCFMSYGDYETDNEEEAIRLARSDIWECFDKHEIISCEELNE